MTSRHPLPASPIRQRGIATILVAILLLAILTVITLFALSVGVFEQRTSSNDSRAKMVHAAAEAGLNQGIEFFKAYKARVVDEWMYPTSPETRRWVKCTSTETTFPCGAETDTTRRARLWRYTDTNDGLITVTNGTARTDNGTTTDIDETRILNFEGLFGSSTQQAITATGQANAFAVDYDVGALLCMIDPDTNQCVSTVDDANPFVGRFAITLVSRARLTAETAAGSAETENAAATHKLTISLYPAIAGVPNAPVLASGAVTGSGSAEIVPNENSPTDYSGSNRTGIPLSIWSNGNADFSACNGNTCPGSAGLGAAQTCHLGEWQTNYNGGNGGPAQVQCTHGSTTLTNTSTPTTCGGITVCTKCKCDGLLVDRGLISGKATQAANAPHAEGIDVLDRNDNSSGQTTGNQGSALPDPSCDGTHFFFPYHPCDLSSFSLDDSLFEYVFGQENSTEAASALEAGSSGSDLGDEWMTNSSSFKKIATDADCSQLNADAEGFYFIKPGVTCTINSQVGTPKHPAAIITDGQFHLGANNILFGMLFVKRYLSSGTTVNGYARINGGGVVYGAVVVEGDIDFNGSVQIVYDSTVLKNLANGGANGGVGRVPGSWSDDVTLTAN